jgi:hypothetical protein
LPPDGLEVVGDHGEPVAVLDERLRDRLAGVEPNTLVDQADRLSDRLPGEGSLVRQELHHHVARVDQCDAIRRPVLNAVDRVVDHGDG